MAIQSTHIGSGGFTPALRRDDVSVSGKASFLASERATFKRSGITLAAALLTADANGDKILPAGTFVTPVTSGGSVGKYGVYSSGASNGQQTPDQNNSGYLPESVNLRDGDVVCGLIIQGSVLQLRTNPSGAVAAIRSATAGRIIYQG
jgi:hypothetical protein